MTTKDKGQSRVFRRSPLNEAINSILERGIKKPNAIISELRHANAPELSKSQLRSFLSYKKSKEAPNVVTIGQMTELLEAHTSSDSPDDPYVVSKEIISNSVDSKKELAFRFFVSTNRLLGLAKELAFKWMPHINCFGKV